MGRAHSNAYRQASKFFALPLVPELHTVAANDDASLAEFASRWGWPNRTTDWRELAANDELDLIDVATPNHLHLEPSALSLEAGKHVACEKPLANDLAGARTLRDAAAKSDSQTFVWFNYRRCPAVALAYRHLRDGRLGAIRHVRARYLQSWGEATTPTSWRFRAAEAGSGAHGDLNAHIVDLCRFLTGEEIVEVHGATTRTFVEERLDPESGQRVKSDVDDATLFLAQLSGGGVASFEATRVAPGHLNDNGIEINGERGSLRFEFEDMNRLHLFDAEENPGTAGWRSVICTDGEHHPYVGAWWPEGHVIGYEHGFVNMVADMMRAIAGEEPEVPLPSFEDGYQVQRVLEAALVSARERCAVALDEVR